MSIPLKAGAVTVTHGDSSQKKQIFIAAKAIWGIESDKLPEAKFNELRTVLTSHLTRTYGPYTVQSVASDKEDIFLIFMEAKVLDPSYEQKPCSLGSCMVTDAAFKCAKCQKAMYCSRDHQVADWARHKIECIRKE